MKILNLTLVMIVFLLMGCSKDETIKSDCIESMLDENNMELNVGQEIGCKNYLELYHYQNKQYFLLGSHCADLISYPTDCEGNTLCEDGEDFECEDFYANAERIGIIGIGE